MPRFRILSLDGGGTWALIQVRALQEIYGPNKTGHEVLHNFDLVAANSGGSLVLGGLIENLPLSEILNLFLDATRRSSIFAPLGGLAGIGNKLLEDTLGLGPKYSASRKFLGIQATLPRFGGTRLDQLPKEMDGGAGPWPRILIPAFDYDLRHCMFFRSDLESLANNTIRPQAPTVAEAIHASTNAPIDYFDQPAIFPTNAGYAPHRFWDGAVAGYNNPVQAAVLETIANRQPYACADGPIAALSIGTGNTSLPLVEPGLPDTTDAELVLHQQSTGLPTDIGTMAKSIVSDPPDAATFAAYLTLGGICCCNPGEPAIEGPLVRMNPMIRPCYANGNWTLPDGLESTEFAALVKLDMDATQQSDVDLITRFCDLWIQGPVPNQAVRTNELFQTLIGQNTFEAAKVAWLSISQ
ncbi:patatin-like phospholipase family protein [Paraburkholderia guartelaensis]|uniref:patatin-like phospholipase family protein n=1 Tax=Paraburkholderia guartelaensis TaxID=2546446 RepID=UPI002AB6F906|nr:patatin-like phospholipase family protein [Paraburkholderia guartelaensis]